MFPISLFKQVEIEVNGVQVNDLSTATYAYKAYIETALTYGMEAKATFLGMAWFDDDEPATNEILNDTNENFKKKRERIAASKDAYFSTIIHADFNQMERYMLPNVQIKYTFIRNSDNFSLLSESGAYKIVIKDLTLSIRRIQIKPEFQNSIIQNLSKEPVLYPITQSKIKTFLINSGTSSTHIQNLSTGNLPKTIIIGFVENKAYDGAINKNPYCFKHFDLNFINLFINGEPYYKQPLQPNYEKGNYLTEYQSMLENLGVHHTNTNFVISMEQFKNGYNFYCFDFTPDLCNSYHNHYTKQGQIDIELHWAKDLAQNIKMIVYSTYNQTLTIDCDYNCLILD
jgi:hypothetical protein